jgi:hypothetical protein
MFPIGKKWACAWVKCLRIQPFDTLTFSESV